MRRFYFSTIYQLSTPIYYRYMLAFKNRFHGHGSLRYVYTHGHTVRSHLMAIKYSTHPKRTESRAAVVVSKKVLKHAVGRNRIRRRMYEVIRQELPAMHENRDLVFLIFSAEVLTVPHEELVETVRHLLSSADAYKK